MKFNDRITGNKRSKKGLKIGFILIKTFVGIFFLITSLYVYKKIVVLSQFVIDIVKQEKKIVF